MLKKYYNSKEEWQLREQSMIVFEEVSSGVYHVTKDRWEQLPKYTNSNEVLNAVNYTKKVAVIGLSKTYSNFESV